MPRYKVFYYPIRSGLKEEIGCYAYSSLPPCSLEEVIEESDDSSPTVKWYTTILDRELIEDAVADSMMLIRKYIKDQKPVFYRISFKEDIGSLIAVKTDELPTGGTLYEVARVNTTNSKNSYWEVYLPCVKDVPLLNIVEQGYNLIQTTINKLKETSYHGGN